ncbi:MAG: hypothetical protein JW760_06495 [Spirochaetales bacterium]|nr:hypothetical protein [Spirochaetales bacterium]
MKGGTLKQASRLYGKGKYSDILRLLEPQVFRYRESFRFYFYLGVSCIHIGDLGGAFSYLSRASDLKKDDQETLNALGALYLKRGDQENALRLWLQVLDLNPKNRKALRGLEFLKKNQDPDGVYSVTESAAFKQFYPRPARLPRILPWAVPVVLLLLALVIGGPYILRFVEERTASRRPGFEATQLQEDETLTEYSGTYRYILTEKEITDSFQRMGTYFTAHRDNLVMKEINYILGSNAAPGLKEKARLLSTYVLPPTFTTIKDSFSYAEVMKDPYLYNGTYVVWKGRVSNLKVSDAEIRFDFLVGYHENQVLEGIVPIELTFAAHIGANLPLEVLGRIQSDGSSILLTALSIHQLEP